MKLFKNWFTKESKPLKIDELYPGDTIHINFLDPKKVYTNSHDINSRFDTQDLKTNSFTGQVLSLKKENLMHLFILEILSVKKNGNIRKYLFFENEITNIELLKRD